MPFMPLRRALSLRCAYRGFLLIAALAGAGCQSTPRQLWNSLKGDGFPEWNAAMSGNVRGHSASAKPSGFFTDRRSEQIEQNLGGGF
jgi:hypothetical protein